ncbi:MAG: CpaD family pilus assembly lipoprotein [Geminicoccaceae bacterium]|nr:CpaD family pilus assembly lipoprotein [Geminicoccaceae bacterium]
MPKNRPAVLLSILVLAACTGLEAPPEPWAGRRPFVHEARYGHVVRFATDRAELDAGELTELRAFVASLPREGRYRAVVHGHADERASDAYNLALSDRRARYVAEILRREGLPAVEIGRRAFGERRPVDPGRGEPAWARNRRVEIEIHRWLVDSPGCGEWDRTSVLHGPQLIPDLGCATMANLVEMVADPADLAEGRPLAPADAVREAEAVQRYRTDKVKQPSRDGE